MMLRTHSTILIRRKIEDVYQFVAVEFFDNYPKWSPEVRELEKLTSGQIRVGVTARQVRQDAGHRSEALFQVTDLRPPHELRFASLSKPHFHVRYLFEPVAAGTRLTFSFQLELPLFLRPLRGRIHDTLERGARQIVHNLKMLLEGDAAAEQEPGADGSASG